MPHLLAVSLVMLAAATCPAQAEWVANTATLAKYVNNTASIRGAVKVATIKPGKLLKVVARSLGDDPLDITSPPNGPVYVTVTIISDGEVYGHCTSFTNCAHKSIAGGTRYRLVCSGGTSGGAGCRPTDVPITGLKLRVAGGAPSAASRARVVFVAKDAAVTKGQARPDPLEIEATLRIGYDGVSGGFIAPAWTTSCNTPPCVYGCFEDWNDGTIRDTCTGLQWEKKNGADHVLPGAGTAVVGNLHDVDNRYSWTGLCTLNSSVDCQPNAAAAAACAAQTGGASGCAECGVGDGTCDPTAFGGITTIWDWITQVNAENFAGHGDWRLATVAGTASDPTGQPAELESIFDAAAGSCADDRSYAPCIDPIFGPTGGSASYWSASSFSDPGFAWRVDFVSDVVLGHPSVSQKGKGAALYVRAVRQAP